MARKSPADESEPCPLHREFMKDLSKEDVSWSWQFPVHGSQDASAVSEEKTSGLVFRKILPHQREVFASPENSLTSAVEEWDEEDWHTWVPSGKSLHPSQNPRDGFWTAKGGSPLERCLCSLRAGAVGGTCSPLRMQMPVKCLEGKRGAQASPGRCSQRQVSQQQVSWSDYFQPTGIPMLWLF